MSTLGVPVLMDVRLTQRNAILVRAGLPYANTQAEYFDTNTTFPDIGGIPGNNLTDLRGWVSVDAKVSGSTIRFIDTHLDSYGPAVRQAQIAELLTGPASTGRKVVLVGDLNAEPQSNVIDQVRAAGLKDNWLIAGKGAGPTCCQPEKLKNKKSSLDRRIDYVFTEAGLQVRKTKRVGHETSDRVGGLWPSDHAGVVSTFIP